MSYFVKVLGLSLFLVCLTTSVSGSRAFAQDAAEDPDRLRFRFGGDHGAGIGFPEGQLSACSMPGCLSWSTGLLAASSSVRFGVQINRHLALSFAPSIWLMSDDIVGSLQGMVEWMPFDILQLGLGVGYDEGAERDGVGTTFRAALNLAGRQSGGRRDGFMLVVTSHVLFPTAVGSGVPEGIAHAYTLGFGYDYY